MPDDFPSERDSTGSVGIDEDPSNAAGGGAGAGGGFSPGSASGGSAGTGGGETAGPVIDTDDSPDAGSPPPGDAGGEVGDGGT